MNTEDPRDARIRELECLLAQALQRIAELERRLGLNSGNSSKPPSSDGFRRVTSLREKNGRRAANRAVARRVILHVQQLLPEERTGEVLDDLFGCPLSSGTIGNILREAGETLGVEAQQTRENLLVAALKHVDETGVRIAKKTMWLHVLSNQQETSYQMEEKRGAVPDINCGVVVGTIASRLTTNFTSLSLHTLTFRIGAERRDGPGITSPYECLITSMLFRSFSSMQRSLLPTTSQSGICVWKRLSKKYQDVSEHSRAHRTSPLSAQSFQQPENKVCALLTSLSVNFRRWS